MTEQTTDTTPQGTEDKLTPPVPDVVPASEPVTSTDTGFDAVAFEERITTKLDEFTESLPGLVDSRFKSATDKPMQDVRRVADYLKRFDNDVEKAAREMAIDRLLAGGETEVRDPGRSSTQSTQMSEAEKTNFEERTAKILGEAGIPLDDPEVAELAKKPVFDKEDYLDSLRTMGIKRLKQGGVTASATVGATGAAVTPVEGDALLAEIMELQESPVINQKAIEEKMDEARKAGLLS